MRPSWLIVQLGAQGVLLPEQREGERKGRGGSQLPGQEGTSGYKGILLQMGLGGIGKAVGTLSLKDSQPPIQADIMSDTTFHPQDDSQFPHQSHSLSSPGFSMLQKKKIRDLRDHSTQ